MVLFLHRNHLLLLLLSILLVATLAFQPVGDRRRLCYGSVVSLRAIKKEKPQGVSSSGYKTDRLNRLADLEESRKETDKGLVLTAAGGFVGLILVLLIAAYASGMFYEVL